MIHRSPHVKRGAALALLASIAMQPALAAEWKPATQVEIVVPNAPGGGNDAVARMMQRIWQEKRLVSASGVVVNRPGGGGNTTLNYLAQKPGDPQTMAVVSVTQQLNYIVGTS